MAFLKLWNVARGMKRSASVKLLDRVVLWRQAWLLTAWSQSFLLEQMSGRWRAMLSGQVSSSSGGGI